MRVVTNNKTAQWLKNKSATESTILVELGNGFKRFTKAGDSVISEQKLHYAFRKIS